MSDLSSLISADSPLLPVVAEIINSRSESVGSGVQTSTGERHAFLATPIHSEAGSESAAPAA